MVNEWIKRADNRMLLFVMFLMTLNMLAFFTNSDMLLKAVEPLLILPILFFFINKYSKIRWVLMAFLIFAIIGDLFHLFSISAYGIQLEAIAYCLGYLCLIYEAIFRIKKLNVSLLIGAYLIMVFGLNLYFLYTFYDVLYDTIDNSLELTLVVIRVVTLFLFSLFSFTVYLSAESKQSILLLLMSISLVFSDVLYLISEYYLYHWVLEFLSKSLYLLTFYCFYLYVVNHKGISVPKAKLREALSVKQL